MSDVRYQLVRDAGQVARMLRSSKPTVFLSASVPYLRQRPKGPLDAAQREKIERNKQHVASAQPARIRSAVVAFTRLALLRGARLVFGAHPAISPLVLRAAHSTGAPERSIVIFQSAFFRDQIPDSTLALADWSAGMLLLTPTRPKGKPADLGKSLELMRELMLETPKLAGALFIGGMDGVVDEADLFAKAHPELPRYALPSTGGAALELWRREQQQVCGTLQDASVLETERSFALLAASVFDDMGL